MPVVPPARAAEAGVVSTVRLGWVLSKSQFYFNGLRSLKDTVWCFPKGRLKHGFEAAQGRASRGVPSLSLGSL